MNYNKYSKIIEQNTFLIKEENILFWHLWCLNYVFEKIEPNSHDFYTDIKTCYQLLWKFNDDEGLDKSFIITHPSTARLLNLDEDIFEDFDVFDISERAIMEMIEGLENILSDLSSEKFIRYDVNRHPINVIDVILDNISMEEVNDQEVFLNEANAQIKLSKKLLEKVVNYTYKDRNIYR